MSADDVEGAEADESADLDTVVVEVRDVIEGLRHNHRGGDGRELVLRVSPPLDGEQRAEPLLDADGDAVEGEGEDAEAIDFRPEAFVDADAEGAPFDGDPAPPLSDASRAMLRKSGAEASERQARNTHGFVMRAWESAVTDFLVDRVESSDERVIVAVRYERGGGGQEQEADR